MKMTADEAAQLYQAVFAGSYSHLDEDESANESSLVYAADTPDASLCYGCASGLPPARQKDAFEEALPSHIILLASRCKWLTLEGPGGTYRYDA